MFYKEVFSADNARATVTEAFDLILAQDITVMRDDPHCPGQQRPAATMLTHLGWNSKTKRMFVCADTRLTPEYTGWINAPVAFTHVAPLGYHFGPTLRPTDRNEWIRVDKIAQSTASTLAESSQAAAHPCK